MNRDLKARIIQKCGTVYLFARKIGKSENWMSKVITGRVNPAQEDKRLIAHYLGCTENDVFPN